KPERTRSSVLLPWPFGPSTTTPSPIPTWSETPCSTSEPAYPAWRSATSSIWRCRQRAAGGPGTHRTQIHVDHPHVTQYLGGCTLGDLLSVVEHQHPAGERRDCLHDVFDHQHGHARHVDPTDQLDHRLLLGGIQSPHRLV